MPTLSDLPGEIICLIYENAWPIDRIRALVISRYISAQAERLCYRSISVDNHDKLPKLFTTLAENARLARLVYCLRLGRSSGTSSLKDVGGAGDGLRITDQLFNDAFHNMENLETFTTRHGQDTHTRLPFLLFTSLSKFKLTELSIGPFNCDAVHCEAEHFLERQLEIEDLQLYVAPPSTDLPNLHILQTSLFYIPRFAAQAPSLTHLRLMSGKAVGDHWLPEEFISTPPYIPTLEVLATAHTIYRWGDISTLFPRLRVLQYACISPRKHGIAANQIFGSLQFLTTIRVASPGRQPSLKFPEVYAKPLFDACPSLLHVHLEQYFANALHTFHEGTLSYFSDRYTRGVPLVAKPERLFTVWDEWKRW